MFNNTTGNATFSNSTEFQDDFMENETSRAVKIVASVVVVVLAVGLNSLVVYPVCRYPNMRKKNINLFIVNMAISDILFVVMDNVNHVEVLASRSWHWKMDGLPGVITCKLLAFSISTILRVSPLSLLFITVERYKAVSSILTLGLTTSTRNVFLVLCWAIPAALFSPFLYFADIVEPFHECMIPHLDLKEFLAATSVLELVVCLVVAGLAVRILKKLRNAEIFANLPEEQRRVLFSSAFHALLQIRAYTKKSASPGAGSISQNSTIDNEDDIPGYQEIPLVEALNGRIAPDNIPEESVARMQVRRSSSARSSGRRASSRAGSAKSQRRIERAMSAGSVRQPRHRPSLPKEDAEPREEARLESYENTVSIASCEEILPAPAEVPATSAVDPVSTSAEEPAENISIVADEEDDAVPELTVHVDVSLPGTPLGSDNSDSSGRSSRGGISASSFPTATPTCVRLEEDDHNATA